MVFEARDIRSKKMQEKSLISSKMPSVIDRHVASLLKTRRLQVGLSQVEVAQQLGITFQQLQKYESGFNRISAGRLWLAANILGVHVSFFFQASKYLEKEEDRIVDKFLADSDAVDLVSKFQDIKQVELRKVVQEIAIILSNCPSKD